LDRGVLVADPETDWGLTTDAEDAVLSRLVGKDLVHKELLRRRLARMKRELCGADPTPLERLLVERVALTWADAQIWDILFAAENKLSLQQAEYVSRARERANRRFLTAARTLAQVRKLALPAVQVNV